jgi:alpha-glucosidase (family GH31 glycosyl hydrolase)
MLAYGQNLVGRENFITMVRPYDDSYDFDGRFFARPEHAPVAWVGDNRRDWIGFIDAMDHTFRSVEAGYRVVGSDLGGYLDRDDTNLTITVPENENAFQTWTAVSALSPFMQLHGRANLTPWTFGENPEFTVSNYRYWAKLHTELIPVMYSLANLPGDDVTPLIDPVGADLDAWQNDWSYLFAGVFHVAAPLDDTLTRDVTLPADIEWFDWWALSEFDGIAGGTTFEDVRLPLGRVPLHIRAGALLPLHVSDNVTGLGLATDDSRTTLLYIGGANGAFTELADDGTTTDWTATFARDEITLGWSRALQPITVHARLLNGPETVTINGTRVTAVASLAALEALEPAQAGWFVDEDNHLFLARVPATIEAGSVVLEIPR